MSRVWKISANTFRFSNLHALRQSFTPAIATQFSTHVSVIIERFRAVYSREFIPDYDGDKIRRGRTTHYFGRHCGVDSQRYVADCNAGFGGEYFGSVVKVVGAEFVIVVCVFSLASER